MWFCASPGPLPVSADGVVALEPQVQLSDARYCVPAGSGTARIRGHPASGRGSRVTDTLLPNGHGRSWAALIVPLALAMLLGILWLANFNPIARYTPGIDSGVYLYIGQQMLKGAAPYRDVFDNKGPLLYLINALGLVLGRGSFWGVYLLEYCLLAGTTIVTWLLLKARVGMLVATAVSVFFILEVAHIALGNHEEEYAVVLQSFALLLLARKPTLEPRRWCWFIAGMLAGGAFFLKPTTVGFWIALAIAVGVVCLTSGEWRHWSGRVLVGVAGAAVASAAVLAYLAAAGALGAFAEDFLGFNTVYVGDHGLADRLASIRYGASSVGYLVAAVAIVAWLLTLRRVLRLDTHGGGGDGLALIAVVWLPIEVALSATSGYSWRQYYFPWLLPTALLLAFSVLELRSLPRRTSLGERLPLPSAAAATLVILALASVMPPSATALHGLGGTLVHYRLYHSRPSQTEQLAAFIRAHTSPDDYVLVWGSHYAMVNMLAERRSPTRYVMQMALDNQGWAERGVPEFLGDLKAHPPALILDSSPSYYPGSAPPIAAGTNHWGSSPHRVSAAWASVYAYLHENYRSQGRLNFAPWWPVYTPRRK